MCCPLVSTVLTLDSTIDFGIFSIMQYFIYFYMQSTHKLSLQYQASPFYKNKQKKLKILKSIYTRYLHSFLHYLHICLFIIGPVPSLCDEYLDCWVSWLTDNSKVICLLLFSHNKKWFFYDFLVSRPVANPCIHVVIHYLFIFEFIPYILQ